jgi:hypothetical protein
MHRPRGGSGFLGTFPTNILVGTVLFFKKKLIKIATDTYCIINAALWPYQQKSMLHLTS